ncbi:unnamed protein product [Protopolystoma xenopodis]|uniref:PH domain-containing protein n=1 Tax=Protopolystoma xenopodis TaxID=117903 RepID=A0A448XBZ3_9PLAT|nr:unnamed protein product [Protopolystoma xenopodis]
MGRDSVKAAPATDYIKRSNVFRIQVAISGAEYLFQAPTSADLHLWVTAINRACDSDTSRPRQRKLASSPQEIVASTLVAGGCVTQTLATATLLALSASVGLENYGRRRPLGSKCERIGNGQADSDKKTKRIRRIMENARREGKVAIGTTGQRNIKQTQKQRDKEEDKDKERKKISRITLKEKVKEKHKTKEECGENDKVKENEKEYIIGEKMGDQNAQEKSSRRQDTAHEWEAVRGEEERVWKASRWIQLHAESRVKVLLHGSVSLLFTAYFANRVGPAIY